MSSTVYDIREMVAHRLPGTTNLYPAINNAIRLIADHLFTRRSNMIQSTLSVKFAPDTASASLPSDFWGLVDWPYQYGKDYPLKPLPNQETELLNASIYTIPEWYKIRNTTLYLSPPPSNGFSLTAEDISFDNGTSQIRSAGGDFVVDSLAEGVLGTIENSTSNDGTFTVSSTVATTLVLTVDETLVDEAAGEEITLQAGIVVCGDYYFMPTKLTTLTDSIPFNEEFDWAIAEAAIMLHTQGNVQAFILDQVNKKLPYRDLKAPSRVRDVKKWHRRW